MWLSDECFRAVIDHSPLVSIDLILVDGNKSVLLGLRRNRPAKGYWFVPGGRVRKAESLDHAFRRLTKTELGYEIRRDQAALLGVYEHLYKDSFFAAEGEGPTTHYIVLAYEITISASEKLTLSIDQHEDYRWWTLSDLDNGEKVHDNACAYIKDLHSRGEI